MDQTAFPFDVDGPDLVLEPVIGWRAWRLRLPPEGELLLESPMQSLVWKPLEPARARCFLPSGRGRSPHEGCGCGLYAASSPDRLRISGVPLTSPGCSVIGTVAMWGKVVEHTAGYRSEFAYPDRLRLACTACFRIRCGSTPTAVFMGAGGELTATCDRHMRDEPRIRITPEELQAELLSTYAVDILPLDALGEPLPFPGLPEPARTLATEARREARELVRTGAGWFGILMLVLAFFALRALGVLTSPPVPVPELTRIPTADAREVVVPMPGTGDPIRTPVADREGGPSVPDIEILCGRREGVVITRVRCGALAADVLGFATHPSQPRGACETQGYTRKGRYSVCWIDLSLEMPAHPLLWPLPGLPFEDLFHTRPA